MSGASGKRSRRQIRWRVRLVDLVILTSTWTVMLTLSGFTTQEARNVWASMCLVAVGSLVTVVLCQRSALYQFEPALPRTDEISRLIVAVAGGAGVMVVFLSLIHI